MQMYAKLNVRKGREIKADIVEWYWRQGMLQEEIAKKVDKSAGYVSQVLLQYWNAKNPVEKTQLLATRTKARERKVKS